MKFSNLLTVVTQEATAYVWFALRLEHYIETVFHVQPDFVQQFATCQKDNNK